MKMLLTIVAFALLCGYLYVLGSEVPRMDLLGVIGVTLLLACWDLFFHDRVHSRRAGKGGNSDVADSNTGRETDSIADGTQR